MDAGRDRQTLHVVGFASAADAAVAADLAMLYRARVSGGAAAPKRYNFPPEVYSSVETRLYACATIRVRGGGQGGGGGWSRGVRDGGGITQCWGVRDGWKFCNSHTCGKCEYSGSSWPAWQTLSRGMFGDCRER